MHRCGVKRTLVLGVVALRNDRRIVTEAVVDVFGILKELPYRLDDCRLIRIKRAHNVCEYADYININDLCRRFVVIGNNFDNRNLNSADFKSDIVFAVEGHGF